MGIRERIIEVAERKGLDYKVLAERSGLPRATVHRYLNGKNDLTGGRIDRIFDVLGLGVGRKRRTNAELHPPEAIHMEPLKGTKPLFRYPGSKWRLMPNLVRMIPRHQHYAVPFGGSGADILRKPPSPLETFNDLDGTVYSLFDVLQDDNLLKALKRKLAATPAQSQRHFENALEVLKDDGDAVLRAWAFLVVSFQGFCVSSPSAQETNRWRYARKPHSTAKNWMKLSDTIDIAAERFQSVQLSNVPWQDVVRKTDSRTTLFMADPPYFPGTVARDYYAHSMTAEEHWEMVSVLAKAKGLVILSGHPNDLYDKTLANWRRIDFGKETTMGINGKRGARMEVLWMNFDEGGRKLKR